MQPTDENDYPEKVGTDTSPRQTRTKRSYKPKKISAEISKKEIKPRADKNIKVYTQPAESVDSHKQNMIFKQLRELRWPDLSTLLGLLCVSTSVYCSFKGFFAVAYALILAQFVFDYADGKIARTIGGGKLGIYLDSFSDFMAVAASVVFGWFVGIDGIAMYIAGSLNIGAAAVRLSYFTVTTQKGFTGVPTVVAAVVVSTIAYLGYLFANGIIDWFVIFYFISALSMISDLRLRKPKL